MTKQEILEKYWFFRPDPQLQRNLMAFGLDIGDGWLDLVNELCEELDKLIKEKYPQFKSCFEVTQVKEKFGGLRFYVSSASEEMYDLISRYEEKSYSICEICGSKNAKIRDGGWVVTLCDTCNKKREDERK